MKKILITGAAGFIGFHLARALKARGDEVLGYDNFNDYYDPGLKRERAATMANIEIIEGDLCDIDKLKHSFEGFATTHIVNLAAQAGVRYSLTHPQKYVSSNIEGFVNILELCKEFPSTKLVYASSSSVYGLNEKIPFSTDDRTDRQASLYGVTKKCNELMAQTYHHLYDIPSTGLRYFTVYGPWGRPDMAYFSFAKNILNNEPIDIFNYGKMLRDFTYIDDIVEGTLSALDNVKGCDIFNFGNNRPVELLNFIEILEKAIGKKAIINYLPMQAGDVEKTYADIDRSREILGFDPKTSLEEGIPKFVEWFKNYMPKYAVKK